MRMLMFGIAGLALVAPPALAQQPPGPSPTSAVSQQTEPGRYFVFFEFDRSDLRPEARAGRGGGSRVVQEGGVHPHLARR